MNSSQNVTYNAAPVGVASSVSTGPPLMVIPFKIFSVAGTGTGIRPCADLMFPPPTLTGNPMTCVLSNPNL